MKKGDEPMKDHYEFKNPRKNPYAGQMKNGYWIRVHMENGETELYWVGPDGVKTKVGKDDSELIGEALEAKPSFSI